MYIDRDIEKDTHTHTHTYIFQFVLIFILDKYIDLFITEYSKIRRLMKLEEEYNFHEWVCIFMYVLLVCVCVCVRACVCVRVCVCVCVCVKIDIPINKETKHIYLSIWFCAYLSIYQFFLSINGGRYTKFYLFSKELEFRGKRDNCRWQQYVWADCRVNTHIPKQAIHWSLFKNHFSELYTEQKESGLWNYLLYETPAFQTNVIVFFLLIIQIDMYLYYI